MKHKLSFIVSSSEGKSYRFFISKITFTSLAVSIGIILILFILSITSNLFLLNHYTKTKQFKENQEIQSNVINTLQSEVKSLRFMVEDLLKKEERIRQDLGKPKYRKLSKRRLIKKKLLQFNRNYPKSPINSSLTHQVAYEIKYLKDHILSTEKKMRKHSYVFSQYLKWFEEMPSVWPVYGYIRSNFGWRVHPLKKIKQFHKGIDIPAWIGAPVQATADGFVEFTGWGGGYGWMIVLSHQFGYQTIYAHLSEIEVSQGLKVSKGQIIGKIGSSGLSTGPHVHYEIRYRRKAVEPTTYLNLNLFTAISKLW